MCWLLHIILKLYISFITFRVKIELNTFRSYLCMLELESTLIFPMYLTKNSTMNTYYFHYGEIIEKSCIFLKYQSHLPGYGTNF